MLNEEEMPGSRLYVLSPEEARQSLLWLTMSDHWAVLNLANIMEFQTKCDVRNKHFCRDMPLER